MKAPYFPFYPQDWLNDERVIQLTFEQRGAYIDLLARMWGFEDCILPDDDGFVARLLHVNPRTWKRFKAVLLDGDGAVFSYVEGGFTQNRLAKEKRKAVEKIGKNREAAHQRWTNAGPKLLINNETGDADALPETMQTHCLPESDTDKERKDPPRPPQGGASHNGSKRVRKRDVVPFREIGKKLTAEEAERDGE